MKLGSNGGLLKEILENLRSTDKLDNHPWVGSLFVQEYLYNNPSVEQTSPGFRLARAVADIFIRSIPGSPPKRGKRLDTQWCAYGILGAQYFVPFLFGTPSPGSFRDSWGRIDDAILAFQFGIDSIESLTPEQRSSYRLVGDESEVTPISTISDWHRKGISELFCAIQDREDYLSHLTPGEFASLVKGDPKNLKNGLQREKLSVQKGRRKRKLAGWLIGLVALSILVFAGVELWRAYQQMLVIRDDLYAAKALAAGPIDSQSLREAGPILEELHRDVGSLYSEMIVYARIFGPMLAWVPEYGPDLADSAKILDAANKISSALVTTYQAGAPIYSIYESQTNSLGPSEVTALLVQAQPQLIQARKDMDSALGTLGELQVERYSSRTRGLLTQLDRPLKLLDTGLSIAVSLPKVLGGTSDGPKTYLVLIQNEDELRATGGFIASVGTVAVKDGDLFGLEFEDTDNLVNWSLPYPEAPWQLRDYMNSPVLVFRDANWFPDYPTTVSWIEYLYAYNNQLSADGVIALDQQMLVYLLEAIGPLTIEDASEPITSGNVVSYMRQAKIPPIQPQPKNWTRKAFIGQMGSAILEKVESDAGDMDWRKLVEMIIRGLNERHLLLQFDDPELTRMLAQWGWDGRITPGDQDYIMVVDSNIGFNKANAAVDTNLTYEVDLADPANPAGTLTVAHHNQSPATRSCVQYGDNLPEESRYPINYCYYDYVRVYVPAGNTLNNASPQRIPADWMILKKPVDAKVDLLEEEIPNVQGYGTLIVVPGGQTITTGFEFAMPNAVVAYDPKSAQYRYELRIQKQAGTKANPLTVTVLLPESAQVVSTDPKAVIDGQTLEFQTEIRTDILLAVVYSLSENPE